MTVTRNETVHFAFLYFLGWFFTKCFQSSCSSTRWIPSFFYVLWCSDAKRRKPYQSRKRNDCSCNKFSKQLYVLYCGSWCPVENLLKKSSARRSGKITLYLKGFLKNSIAYLIANYLVHVHMYLTIIPRVGNGYEVVNSMQCWVGMQHCFIKIYWKLEYLEPFFSSATVGAKHFHMRWLQIFADRLVEWIN